MFIALVRTQMQHMNLRNVFLVKEVLVLLDTNSSAKYDFVFVNLRQKIVRIRARMAH